MTNSSNVTALPFAFSEAEDAGEQVTKLKFRADCLPFPHSLDAVGHEVGFRAYYVEDALPFPHMRFRNIASLVFYFVLDSRQAGGAIEHEWKMPTGLVGIFFDTRVKEREGDHVISIYSRTCHNP